jgi:dihydrofolate reductase
MSLDQLHTADMLIFGRKTYQGLADYWTKATGEVAEQMNNLPKAVFSRTLEKAEWNNTRLIKALAEEEVRKLKA